jgi:hypothetical protein
MAKLDETHAARSRSAYNLLRSPMEAHFRARYVAPSGEALSGAAREIQARRDRLWALVPMGEDQPGLAKTVAQAARYLRARIPGGRVLFVDGGSCPENVAAARAEGAAVLGQDRIFDAIDWERLLPILNLPRRPSGRAGQGFNVFAGHLALAALGLRDGDVVFQCDADVQDYERIAPLERLVAAWAREDGIRHAKLAQSGRNNETVMAARAMAELFSALDLPWIPQAVKHLGHEVFMALAPDKWLTCGIYLVTEEVVRARPFASGYLDATTQALWTTSAPECGWRGVRHVECPVPCRDAENTATKEALMMSSIALLLQSVVMHGKALHLWTLDDMTRINLRVMPRLCDVPAIGDGAGPVAIHRIEQDRMVPPVSLLCRAGIVDLGGVAEIASVEGR